MLTSKLPKLRRGSVLIIVIVLLLLLAILGAAYISTAHSDRVSSAQSLLNADADTQIDAIANAVSGTIVDDLNDNVPVTANTNAVPQLNLRNPVYTITGGTASTVYRNSYLGAFNATMPNANFTYNIGDVVGDSTTASVPSNYYMCTASGTVTPPPSSGWTRINRWPGVTSNGVVASGGSDALQPWLADRVPFSNGGIPTWQNITQSLVIPAAGGAPVAMSILGTPFESPNGTTVPPSAQYTQAVPASLSGSANNLVSDGTNVPALSVAGTTGVAVTVVAGDADNDGIADSLLFRIPGTYFDGLTWYAGVRIIDNNSAVNVNTAFSRDNEYPFSTGAAPALGTVINNYYGLFQSGVGLWELLANVGGDSPAAPAWPAQLTSLAEYVVNNRALGGTGLPQYNGIPLDESTVNVPSGTPANPTPATSNAPITRTDYQFVTLGDAMYSGLIRRLANPAINYLTAGASANTFIYSRYQALPLSDEAALASHFCLYTPDTSGPQTRLEQLLQTSLWTNAKKVGNYDPSNVGTATTPGWFGDNFAYPTPANPAAVTLPLRPLLVTRNPVSNYVQPVYDASNLGEPINPRMLPWGDGDQYGGAGNLPTYNHFRGMWAPTPNPAYAVNDIVTWNVNGSAATPSTIPGYNYTFICVTSPAGANPPGSLTGSGNNTLLVNPTWHLQPWTNHPVKANVNTAPFAELFRAFWCVMAGNPANPNALNQPPFNNWSGPAAVGSVTQPWDYNPYDPTSTYPAATTTTTESGGYLWHQFRSPLRDMTTNSGAPPNTAGTATVVWMDPSNVAVLRSAIAAVNTLGLRDQSQNVISRQVPIQVYNASTTQPSPLADTWNAEATVYSAAPQPFITEVYATNDSSGDDAPTGATGKNPFGYVGIELYNPYPYTMTLTNWQVAVINRQSPTNGGTYPNMTVAPLSPNPLGTPTGGNYVVQIPAYSYALLENYPAPGTTATTSATTDATYRPAPVTNSNSTIFPTNGMGALNPGPVTDVYVNNLQNVISGGPTLATTGGEFVLLRPRRADGQPTSSNDPFNTYNEGTGPTAANLYDLVPVDSYDFTGMIQAATGPFTQWSYARQKPAAVAPPAAPTSNLFLATNGGVYVGNAVSPAPRQQLVTTGGAQTYPTEAEMGAPAIPFKTMICAFGLQFPPPTTATTQPTTPPLYPPFPPVQIYNTNNLQGAAAATVPYPTGATSPNALEIGYNEPKTTPAAQAFPFGGSARNGDMLNIPFVGAYRIRSGSYSLATGQITLSNTPATIVEMNALPMDCAFADDGDTSLNYPTASTPPAPTSDDSYENVGRFCPTTARPLTAVPAPPATDYYFWTRRLFDYLTVQSNDNNYMPNFDPGPRDDYLATADAAPLSQESYFGGPVTQVYNSDGAAQDQTQQDTCGVEGLININTASAEVLSLLPLVTKGDEGGASPTNDCYTVAQAIVSYRNANGPFMSIYDLNKVTGFQTANGKITIGTPNTFAATGNTAGTANTLNSNNGLLTPPDIAFPSATPTASNGLTEDYQSDNTVLSRISNMITTRSDTFTVYIVIEGWQNAILPGQKVGASLPQLKVVRHYAFIADRSQINQDVNSRFLRTLTVPNN
jgi:hypothetical protein